MKKFEIRAKTTVDVVYYIQAETQEEARKIWEDIDPSMGDFDEESAGWEEFDSIREIIPSPVSK